MPIFKKSFAALVGVLLGVILAFIFQLTLGNGLQLIPISSLLTPFIIGASTGFIVGYIFNKFIWKVLIFLGHFLNI